jgi:hypothetical protein
MSGPKSRPKKIECGPRPATLDRMMRGFLRCPLSPRSGAMTASARQPSEAERLKPVALDDLAIAPRNPRSPAALFLLAGARGGGGRNARATSRALTRFWKFSPWQFAFANRRPPLALPQSYGKLRNAHVSLDLTFTQVGWRAQHKNRARLCRNCGRREFPVEDRGKLRINRET